MKKDYMAKSTFTDLIEKRMQSQEPNHWEEEGIRKVSSGFIKVPKFERWPIPVFLTGN